MKKIVPRLILKFSLVLIISDILLMVIFRRYLNHLAYAHILETVVEPAALGLLMVLLIKNTFSKPLEKIFLTLDALEKGNLGVKLNIQRPAEMKILAQNVNRVIDSLKSYYDRAQEAIRVLTSITDGVDEAIMLIDKNFKIIWANKRVIDLSHLKAGDVLSNFCYKVTHHSDEPCKAPHDICPVHEVMAKGKPVTILHTHYDAQGRPFYVEVTAYPVKDESGNIHQFIHIGRDVSERMRMVEDLKKAKNRIEEYSSSLELMVAEKTADLQKSMQYSEKQRKAILNILEDVDATRKELSRLNEELKQAQAQLVQSAKMAAVGQLASGVAHEINNPLTGVLNNLQLIKMESELKKDFSANDFKDLLNIIEESALRCKRITHYLLDFAHASEERFQQFSLNELIEKVIILIEHEMKLENIVIQKELQPNIPQASGDPQLFQQIIFNIITNAKWAIEKKSGKDGGVITIKTQSKNKNIILSLSDTGIGIPKENQEKIFEPFFTTKPVGEGTGLGLSLVYSIIKKHQGEIKVESQLGKGTTFIITLPVTPG